MVSVAGRRLFGLAVSGVIVGAVIAACRPNGDVGYVEIKTVPAAPITLTALYIDSAKLAPIRKGSAILRQPIGTLKPTAPPARWRRCARSSWRAIASPRSPSQCWNVRRAANVATAAPTLRMRA